MYVLFCQVPGSLPDHTDEFDTVGNLKKHISTYYIADGWIWVEKPLAREMKRGEIVLAADKQGYCRVSAVHISLIPDYQPENEF